MMRIFKYSLTHAAEINIVHGPIVRPLTIDIQRGIPCLWAVVDTSLQDREYEVICVGTGWDMPEISLGSYLNTTITADDQLVFHWFCREVRGGVGA